MTAVRDAVAVAYFPSMIDASWAVWDMTERKARSFFRDPEVAECQAVNDRALSGHEIAVRLWCSGTLHYPKAWRPAGVSR